MTSYALPDSELVGAITATGSEDVLDDGAREAWNTRDLRKGLGVARDVVSVGRKGTDIGFRIAGTATKFGFGIAKGTLRGVGHIPGLGRVMKVTENLVGVAQDITEGSQALGRAIALGSMDAANAGLDAAGAEKYELARGLLGSDEVDACIVVSTVASKLSQDADLQAVSTSDFITGLVNYYSSQAPSALIAPDRQMVSTGHLARLMWLSAAMYGARMNKVLGLFRHVHCSGDEFLTVVAADLGFALHLDRMTACPRGLYQPACAILVDDTNQEVVVAIRGTSNMRDALTDLVCAPARLAPGQFSVGDVDVQFVHDGMWRAAQSLLTELQDFVHILLEERPSYRLMITGHSLGAGVAGLLCLLWRQRLGERVSCISFASPQTLDDAAARAAAHQGVTSVLVGDDLVPRLSLRSATHLTANAVSLATVASRVGVPPPSVPALYPAGRLLHHCAGAAPQTAFVADQDDFGTIRVSPSMLFTHMQPAYLRALGACSNGAASL